MKLIESITAMKEYSSALKKGGSGIALVPTMGALHAGHLSLLARAREVCDVSVMSVFVNPAQFGPTEDFAKYPRDLESDRALAESAGCDCLFAPSAAEMYPDGYCTYVDAGPIGDILCGAARPGHFRGVATVVLKLFNITAPAAAVFGAKDAQQTAVIKRAAADLNLPVRIITAPTLRDADGLAMSSRNTYLTPGERKQAANICKALFEAKSLFEGGECSVERLKNTITSTIIRGGLIEMEYADIVDPVSLRPFPANTESPALIAVACRTTESKTRLIDNVVAG
ncbi:MAG: pantoate--beta-alanine ligase [Chitinispirillales bacterium]|jgi:pantoate--beta-alanine ligase|nr:pantoate--beta-alanine ligase [Chitinispirillales bacterium]